MKLFNIKNTIACCLLAIATVCILTSCDKKNDDLVKPLTADEFPQVIKFDDEGDGSLEDEDEFGFKLTLVDRVDPSGKELGGTVVPLQKDVTVVFRVKEWEGFDNLADYIKGAKAFYEIDDCTTSEDQGIDLNLAFNTATGQGSVTFPRDVEELEVVFEVDEDYFNDDMLNDDERSITLVLTAVEGDAQVTVNNALEFKYEVLDDEGVHGDWELDHEDPAAFAAFTSLFGLVNEDVKNLSAADVDKIEISIEYNEVKVLVTLLETEMVDDCGVPEFQNKEIEIEADLEDLSTLVDAGDIEVVGELELPDGSSVEFVYSGSFTINGDKLELVLKGELDEDETDETTLPLSK